MLLQSFDMPESIAKKSKNIMSDSFLRQRRNLLVVNGLILFMYFSKVKVNKLSVAGMNFQDFGNPSAIYLFIWIIWIYFIYRFVLYFKEDELDKVIDITTQTYYSFHDKYYLKLLKAKDLDFNMVDEGSFIFLKKNNYVCTIFNESFIGGYRNELSTRKKIHFSLFDFLLAKFNFCFYILFATTIITNYLVPPLLSILTIYLSFNSTWEGSFNNVLNSL